MASFLNTLFPTLSPINYVAYFCFLQFFLFSFFLSLGYTMHDTSFQFVIDLFYFLWKSVDFYFLFPTNTNMTTYNSLNNYLLYPQLVNRLFSICCSCLIALIQFLILSLFFDDLIGRLNSLDAKIVLCNFLFFKSKSVLLENILNATPVFTSSLDTNFYVSEVK